MTVGAPVDLGIVVGEDGKRYLKRQRIGTTWSLLQIQTWPYEGPVYYVPISGTPNAQVDGAMVRNKDGDVIAVQREQIEAIQSVTSTILRRGEQVGTVSAAIIVIVMPGPEDLVISGVLATTLGKKLLAKGFEIASDGLTMVVRREGKVLTEEAAAEVRLIIKEAMEEAGPRVIDLPLPGTFPNGAKIRINGVEAIIHVLGVDTAEDLVKIIRAARHNGATKGTLFTGKVVDPHELAPYSDLVKRGETRFGGKVTQLGPDTFQIDFESLPNF